MVSAALHSKNGMVPVICVLMAALYVANNLLGLFIAPRILAAVAEGAPIGELVFIILAFSAGLLIVNALMEYVKTNQHLGQISVRHEIAGRISDKIGRTSYPNTENQHFRNLYDQAGHSTKWDFAAAQGIWGTFENILKCIAGFIIYIFLLQAVAAWVPVLVFVTTVLGFFASAYFNTWSHRNRAEQSEYSSRMFYVSRKAYDTTIAKDIRLFGMRDWLLNLYDSTMKLFHNFNIRREIVGFFSNIIDVVLNFARNGIAYVYLINLVINGNLSAPEFLLYFLAIGGFTAWVSGILEGLTSLYEQSLDISVVREFLQYGEPFKFEDGKPITPDLSKKYELELKNVSFCYPAAETSTLKNINLKIAPGEKLAIVGLNGAGKTTLIKVLAGLYDPTDGEVFLNGEGIKQYNRRDYYRHFTTVFQDFSLIETSIIENITQEIYTNENVLDKAKSAAQMAGIHEKIMSLPKGYLQPLGKSIYDDGVELSGGEIQKLMLARALYKNAPIIILDEPTAALDPIAESEMYNKYNELVGGRTSVYISHRLASTRFCDRIVHVQGGEITEEGTHEELIKNGGGYAELYQIQSHYYKEGEVENV